jgi:hypothetical protein
MKRTVVAALAMLTLSASSVAASSEGADSMKVIHAARDSRTGAEIKIRQGSQSDVQIDVQQAGLGIQKSVRPGRTTVVVRDGKETLTIAMERGVLAVSSRAGVVRVTALNLVDMPAAQARVAGFSGLGRAIMLLRGLDVAPRSPLQPILLSLRALLESGRAEYHAASALDEWHRALKERATVRPVSQKDLTASECWDEYAKEAIRARIDYEHCVADLRWYELLDYTGCATVYDLRAIAAMAWFLRCVGLGVNGLPLP